MKRHSILTYTTVVLCFMATGCVDEEVRQQEQELVDRFEKAQRHFQAIEREVSKQFHLWKAPVLAETPYRRGKLLVMDKAIFGGLPGEMLAESVDECETLVVMRKDKRFVGEYSNGGKAYRWQYEVRLIDSTAVAVVGEKTFEGGPPPDKIYIRSKEGVGSEPDDDVVAWIRNSRRGPDEEEILESAQLRKIRKKQENGEVPTSSDLASAVRSLQWLGDLSKYTDFLKSCLKANTVGRRIGRGESLPLVATLEILARKDFGGADVFDDVARLTTHPSDAVRQTTIKTILASERDDPILFETLREMVENDENIDIRQEAMRAAYARFPVEALPVVVTMLNEIYQTRRLWPNGNKRQNRGDQRRRNLEAEKLKVFSQTALDIILLAPQELTASEDALSAVYSERLMTWDRDPKYVEIDRWFQRHGYDLEKIDTDIGSIHQKRMLGWNPSDWGLHQTVNWPNDTFTDKVIVEAVSPQGRFIVVTGRGERLLLSCSAPSFKIKLDEPPITPKRQDFVFCFSDDETTVYPVPLRNDTNDSDAEMVVTAVEIKTGHKSDKNVKPLPPFLRFGTTHYDGIEISIWEHPDYDNHRELKFNEDYTATAECISNTGLFLLLGDAKGRLLFVDTLGRQIAHRIQLENHKSIHSIAISSNEKWIAVATEDGIDLFGRSDADRQPSDSKPQLPPTIISLHPEKPKEKGVLEVHVQSHFDEPWHVVEYRIDEDVEWKRAAVPEPAELVKIPIHDLVRGHHVLELKTTDTAGRSSEVACREFDVSYWSAVRTVNADNLSSISGHQITISPDCKVISTIAYKEFSLNNLETGEQIATIPLEKLGNPSGPPLFLPNGSGLFTFGAHQMTAIQLPSGRIRFSEVRKKSLRPSRKPKTLPKPIFEDSVSLVILGNNFVTLLSQGSQLAVIPLKSDMSPNVRRRTKQPMPGVRRLVAWPDSTLVIGCKKQGGIVVWDVEHAMQLELVLPDVIRNEQISRVISCKSSTLAVFEGDTTIHVFDISRDGQKVVLDHRCRINLSKRPGQSELCESSGLLAIVPSGGGREITIWNTQTGLLDSSLSSDSIFRKIRFNPDGRTAVTYESSLSSAEFRIWEIKED